MGCDTVLFRRQSSLLWSGLGLGHSNIGIEVQESEMRRPKIWEICLLDGPSLGRQKSPRYLPSLQYPCPGLYPTTLPTFQGLYWYLLSDLTENVSAWSGSSVTLGPKSKVGLLHHTIVDICFVLVLFCHLSFIHFLLTGLLLPSEETYPIFQSLPTCL